MGRISAAVVACRRAAAPTAPVVGPQGGPTICVQEGLGDGDVGVGLGDGLHG